MTFRLFIYLRDSKVTRMMFKDIFKARTFKYNEKSKEERLRRKEESDEELTIENGNAFHKVKILIGKI